LVVGVGDELDDALLALGKDLSYFLVCLIEDLAGELDRRRCPLADLRHVVATAIGVGSSWPLSSGPVHRGVP
jgi:hypothetical protein